VKNLAALFVSLALAGSVAAQDRHAGRSDPDEPQFRYAPEDRPGRGFDRRMPDFRTRCVGLDRRDARRCEDRVREVERRNIKWRAEARKRRADFEDEMARRERDWRHRERERWERHQREIDRWLRDAR